MKFTEVQFQGVREPTVGITAAHAGCRAGHMAGRPQAPNGKWIDLSFGWCGVTFTGSAPNRRSTPTNTAYV